MTWRTIWRSHGVIFTPAAAAAFCTRSSAKRKKLGQPERQKLAFSREAVAMKPLRGQSVGLRKRKDYLSPLLYKHGHD